MRWFNSHKKLPDFYKAYLNAFKEKPQSINAVRFVIFDTETTGLNLKEDRILSIGTVAIKNFQINISDSLECYIKQNTFNPKTVEVHGLLKEGSFSKISEKESIKLFIEHIGNSVLVAHHAAFDIAMINEALKRLELPKLKNKVIDTGILYKKTKYINDNKPKSLDELCQLFNITMHDRHTASGDAYLTALLFLKLSSKLKQKYKHLSLRLFRSWF
ncbi:PolC-type DNA polymerase III [Psychroserpens sp. XS_ASV72]|uniref:3'-5' exonuclease n=1 Tax=Psychroserpens sp. XS_ASV72 TaxID=3241293 RepID=UPI00351990A9